MKTKEYDVVIVGAGVSGALTAKYLSHAGLQVLLLEAGPNSASAIAGYDEHLRHFYEAAGKGPESAWPPDPNVPQPDTANLRFNNGYFVQNGPDLYGSSYTRLQGGSTLHWLGVSLRMLPEDFSLKSSFGVGRDWPLSYDDIEPYYRKAETELGVSADVADQRYLGIKFPDNYDYPMQRIPLSYSDQMLGRGIDGKTVNLGEQSVAVKVRSYPAARNSTPRGSFRPAGAADKRADGHYVERFLGERCQGNTSCTPICPVQAKYNAGKTLAQAKHERLEIISQAVASKININAQSGLVESISYKRYDGDHHTEHQVKGRAYVLAAHAVENAKLLLLSNLSGSKGLVGRNLMDHPTLYAWGLSPEPVWPFRGPLSTAGIEDLRAGPFRNKHAAFRFDVGNDGWRASTGAPDSEVVQQVMTQKRVGKELRQQLTWTLSRQVRMSVAVEQLPDMENRVTLDHRFLDPLGNPRPAINYRISDYTLRGMQAATNVYRQIFTHAGIQDCSGSPQSSWFPSVNYGDSVFHYHGMGHFAGTHLMGSTASDSVVDHSQCCWEHRNLYLVGSGSFPTMGTSNPTLTLSALAIRTAELLIKQLKASDGRFS